jgi:hypothetical protein
MNFLWRIEYPSDKDLCYNQNAERNTIRHLTD